MVIRIGTCSDEKEKMNKTFTVKKEFTQATLKEATSIVDPVIIITQPTDVSNINYCYIPALGRYYYIQDITALTGNRVALNCHCDVLMSFKSQIKNCQAIIDKSQQSSNSNVYLNDESFITECKDVLQSLEFPSGFTSSDTIIITAGG